MTEPPDTWAVARVRLAVGSALLVAATFVVATVIWNLLSAAHRTIGWVVASTVVALVLEPVVRTLERHMRRGLAIALTVVATVLVTGAVVAGVFTDLRQQVDRLRDDLPEAATALEQDSGVGEAASDFELRRRVDDFVDQLDQRISQRAAAEGALDTGPAYFVNVVLVMFLLGFGTRVGNAALNQLPDEERRSRYATVVTEAITRGQHYILRSLGLAVVVGTGTGLIAWALDLPAPAVLGVVMGAFAFVPAVGVLLGAVPVLLLSAGFKTGVTTALLAVAFLAVQGASARVMHRYVDSRTVRVGPAVIVIVALIGFDVYGFGGTFYGTALAVFAIAALEVATTEKTPPAANGDDTHHPPSGEGVNGSADETTCSG